MMRIIEYFSNTLTKESVCVCKPAGSRQQLGLPFRDKHTSQRKRAKEENKINTLISLLVTDI
jgi:hypothetical protein